MEIDMKIVNTILALSLLLIIVQNALAGDIRDLMNKKVKSFDLADRLIANPDDIRNKLIDYKKESTTLYQEKEFSHEEITKQLQELEKDILILVQKYNKIENHNNDIETIFGGFIGALIGGATSARLLPIDKITTSVLKTIQTQALSNHNKNTKVLIDLFVEKIKKPFAILSPDEHGSYVHAGLTSKKEAYIWAPTLIDDIKYRYEIGGRSFASNFYSDEIIKSYEAYVASLNKINSLNSIAKNIESAISIPTTIALTSTGAYIGAKAGNAIGKKLNPPRPITNQDLNYNDTLDKN